MIIRQAGPGRSTSERQLRRRKRTVLGPASPRELVVIGGVVDKSVVVAAQGHGAGEVGAAATGPGIFVVEFAPGVGAVAVLGGTVVVDDGEGGALWVCEEAFLAAQVEDLAGATEDSGEDPGVTGGPACCRG